MEKYAEYSPKSESSKPAEDEETGIRNVKLLYRNSGNANKSSGVSSDDETTSSSLLPIPDTLRQIRNQLKKTITDIGEPSEVESSFTAYEAVEESTEKVRNSLDELRRKYTLKTETSVAIKMDSAKLMLDDILSRSNVTANYCETPDYFREKKPKPQAVPETEGSTAESSVESSMKHCHFTMPPQQALPHSIPPIAFGCPPHFCPLHGNVFKHVCDTCSPQEKALKASEENAEESQRRTSLLEKLQNFHVKYKIQSIYRLMQRKANPFARTKKDTEHVEVEQGIPGSSAQDPTVTYRPTGCKCPASRQTKTQYPRKMIFDLVETSESSRSESKGTERLEKSGGMCTCYRPWQCTCPEVIPQCFCGNKIKVQEAATETTEILSKHEIQRTSPPEKVDEYMQTEAEVIPQYKVPEKKEQETQSESEAEHIIRQQRAITSRKQKTGWKAQCVKKKSFERTDIYYFDHGNSAYYQTTDIHPVRYTECLVQRTDEYATKFWAEIFGTIEIGIAFIISFIIQLYRFIFTSIIRSLTIGLLQIFSDYFFKPLLTIIFNGVIQPCLILAYNIATSLRDLCLPISQTFGFFAKEVANIFRSLRIVEVNQCNCKQSSCYCGNKV